MKYKCKQCRKYLICGKSWIHKRYYGLFCDDIHCYSKYLKANELTDYTRFEKGAE